MVAVRLLNRREARWLPRALRCRPWAGWSRGTSAPSNSGMQLTRHGVAEAAQLIARISRKAVMPIPHDWRTRQSPNSVPESS
jgi:hypothetical protein